MSIKIKVGWWGFMLDNKLYVTNPAVKTDSIKADIIMDGKNVTIHNNEFTSVLNRLNVDGNVIITFIYNNQLIIGEYVDEFEDISFYNIDEEEVDDIIPKELISKAMDFCESNCSDRYKFF